MKILLLGTGKSGTTALVYKLAGGLPNCHAFSGGSPGKYLGDFENAVYKHTYEESKGKSFELFREHLEKEHYDRKIWMARDPRDVAVSVLRKEKDPRSIPFFEIYRYSRFNRWPLSTEEVFEEEQVRYQRMHDFVKSLGGEWFLFTYENMLANSFDALNEYLGFNVLADAEVPKSTGKAKVIRKKASGDWQHWFTEADVELFKPAYTHYMELIGYDCQDWTLNPNPAIEPEYSSVYMQNQARKATKSIFKRYLDSIVHRLAT
jgi:hypothetical protein